MRNGPLAGTIPIAEVQAQDFELSPRCVVNDGFAAATP
jgi:hypothetical protein